MNKLELMKTANEVRKSIVTAVHSAKSGHPGGSLSAADSLFLSHRAQSRCLYKYICKIQRIVITLGVISLENNFL